MKRKFSRQSAIKIDTNKDFLDVSSVFGNAVALLFVRIIYNTVLTPIHVTFLALVSGVAGVFFIYSDGTVNLIIGALLIQVKNIFDAADGSLARARNTPSRIGRFLDSVVDFFIGLLLFLAIGFNLSKGNTAVYLWPLVTLAFLCSMIQCSYYVYYNIQYLLVARQKDSASRADESFTDDDMCVYSEPYKQKILQCLQHLFLLFYGWQDKFVKLVDHASLGLLKRYPRVVPCNIDMVEWYDQKKILQLNSVLGLGTQLFLMSFMVAIGQMYAYLWIVMLFGNGYLVWLILYRINCFKRLELLND